MGAFFKALTSKQVRGALPAADLFVEFYTPSSSEKAKPEAFLRDGRRVLEVGDSGIMVRIFYNETVSAPGKLLDMNSTYTNPMSLEKFQTFISDQLMTYPFNEIQDMVCNNAAYQFNTNYFSPDTWRNNMKEIYTALNSIRVLLGATIVLAFAGALF
jgi:hypothetical protein